MPLVLSINGVIESYRPNFENQSGQTDEFARVLNVEMQQKIHDENKRRSIRSIVPQKYFVMEHPVQEHRRPAITARDLMTTPVVTVRAHTTIQTAWGIINASNIQHLPVISEDGSLIGIISDRDLLKANPNFPSVEVAQIMNTKVISATADTSIREIAHVLLDEGIHCLPILENETKVAGILTTTDILKAVWNNSPMSLWV